MAKRLLLLALVAVFISVCNSQQNVTLPSSLALATPVLNVMYYASQEDVGPQSNVYVARLLAALQSTATNYTKQCSLNVTYRYLPDNFNFNTVMQEYNISQQSNATIVAGSQYWLVDDLIEEMTPAPSYVAVYESPATIESMMTIAAIQNITTALTQLAANLSVILPTTGMNLTLIFDQSINLQFLTTFIGQLSGNPQFRLWTLYCPQINSSNGQTYLNNLLTASGIHFVIASTNTVIVLMNQLRLQSYTDYDFSNNIYYSNSGKNLDLWLFYNLTSFSSVASQLNLFQLVPAMVAHLEPIDPAYVPPFCYQFFKSIVPKPNPLFTNPSGNPQLTWSPSEPLAGGMTLNQLQECEFSIWLMSYYNQFCGLNQAVSNGQWIYPSFQNVQVSASSGNLTYNNITGLRTSARLFWHIGLTSQYDFVHGQVQVVNNALTAFQMYPPVNTLCRYLPLSTCPNAATSAINVTVSVPNLPPYYFTVNNVTYGYYYQITQLLAKQFNWIVTYNVTNANTFVGDWTGPTSSANNNVSSGVVYALQNIADIAIGPLLYSSYQQSFVVYSSPVVTSPFSVLMATPNPQIPASIGMVWIFSTPFAWQQWLLFGASIVFLSILLTIIDNIAPNRFRFHIVRSIYYITARGVQGMAGISPNRWSSRLLIIFWGFTTMIFVQSFTANLTSTTIYQQEQRNAQPTTINNLISSSMTLGTVQNSLILQYLAAQNDSLGKMVYSALSMNVPSIAAGIQEIYARQGTIYQPYGFLYLQAFNDYYASQSCGALVSQPVFNSVELVLALPDSAFPKISVSTLNQFISNNTLNLISIFTNSGSYAQSFPQPQCNASDWLNTLSQYLDGNSANTAVFTLVTLIGPFILIAGGIGAAFGIILFEFIFVSIRRLVSLCAERRRASEAARGRKIETPKEKCTRVFREAFCFFCDIAKEKKAEKAAKEVQQAYALEEAGDSNA